MTDQARSIESIDHDLATERGKADPDAARIGALVTERTAASTGAPVRALGGLAAEAAALEDRMAAAQQEMSRYLIGSDPWHRAADRYIAFSNQRAEIEKQGALLQAEAADRREMATRKGAPVLVPPELAGQVNEKGAMAFRNSMLDLGISEDHFQAGLMAIAEARRPGVVIPEEHELEAVMADYWGTGEEAEHRWECAALAEVELRDRDPDVARELERRGLLRHPKVITWLARVGAVLLDPRTPGGIARRDALEREKAKERGR